MGSAIELLADVTEPAVLLLEVPSGKLPSVAIDSVKALSDKGMNVVVLSAVRPCVNLVAQYNRNKVNTEKVLITCCICSSQGQPPVDTDSVIHVTGGIVSLTEMAIVLNAVLAHLKGKSFLVIDSVSSLLIHNSSNAVARFVHAILVKLQINNMGAVLLLAKDDNGEKVRAEVMQLCDKVLTV